MGHAVVNNPDQNIVVIGGGELGAQRVIGTARITANFMPRGQSSSSALAGMIRSALERNNWVVKSCSVVVNSITYSATANVVVNLYNTMDTGTIRNMFIDDVSGAFSSLRGGFGSVAVEVSTSSLPAKKAAPTAKKATAATKKAAASTDKSDPAGNGGFDLSSLAIGGLSGGMVVGLLALVVLMKR